MKLCILYFSGTGNTHYVAHYLTRRLAHLPLECELRSMEWQPAGALADFDLLAVGFPVYAAEAPSFFQDYLQRLPPGEGRGAFAFCTKGAYAGSAVQHTLQRLATRGYVPLGGGSVLMPGTDGLSMISKDSWMARKALEKDYDRLKDADRFAEEMGSVLLKLVDGQPADALRLSQPSGYIADLCDRVWAFLYEATEEYARSRLHADERCAACGLCARLCPVGAIELCDERPVFADNCALCIRCLHNCPQEAIQIGRLTTNKLRWKGPKGDFKALVLRPEGRDGTSQ